MCLISFFCKASCCESDDKAPAVVKADEHFFTFVLVIFWAFLSGAEKIPKMLKKASLQAFYDSRDFAGSPTVWGPEVSASFHGKDNQNPHPTH